MNFLLVALFLLVAILLLNECKKLFSRNNIQNIIRLPVINQQDPGKGFSTYYSPQECLPKNDCFPGSYVRN